ncbi:hypothetical protein [Reinekea sp.]|uniref:hypothetical protein n=1 Tax=Reinekea sp. TaxID=1970455 RepID=UPI003988E4EC
MSRYLSHGCRSLAAQDARIATDQANPTNEATKAIVEPKPTSPMRRTIATVESDDAFTANQCQLTYEAKKWRTK